MVPIVGFAGNSRLRKGSGREDERTRRTRRTRGRGEASYRSVWFRAQKPNIKRTTNASTRRASTRSRFRESRLRNGGGEVALFPRTRVDSDPTARSPEVCTVFTGRHWNWTPRKAIALLLSPSESILENKAGDAITPDWSDGFPLKTTNQFETTSSIMDNPQYHSNALTSNNASYLSHQLQESNSNLPPHTLPPLQPQHAIMQSLYGSASQASRSPATPNAPGSANTLGNFPQVSSQSRNYQMMSGNGSYQQPQAYRTSTSMMSQPSTAMQPIAPAPVHNHNRMPQTLRPMPPHGLPMQSGLGSPYDQNMLPQNLMLRDEPTHVVGSQGRRGILPSAPGRPAVTATGTGSTKNAMIPAKDADGKFPCPHCTKTYLHAKHLKRHLLRHTGDRPYMCVLCRDTFSRSDILKRHFQKCSIRRGNPTGASHLSHAQAHLKKSHPGAHKSTPSLSNESNLMGVNDMNSMPTGTALHPFGVGPEGSIPDAGSNMTDEQAPQDHLSRPLKRHSTGGGRDMRSLTGPGPGGASRTSFDQEYTGGIQGSMPSGMSSSLAFSMPNDSYAQNYNFASQAQTTEDMSALSNGRTMPAYAGSGGGQQGLDWSQMFQPAGNDNFISSYNPNMTNPQVPIKQEQAVNNSNNSMFSGVYPSASSGLNFFVAQNEPLEQISNQLIDFCFPPNSQVSGRSNDIRNFLSADNIKHFLDNFFKFQVHLPIIHSPTFKPLEAYAGLLMGMVCVGAVYSHRVTPAQVRDMMEFAKAVIERNSQVFAVISREQNGDASFGNDHIGSSKAQLEEITAVCLMQVLFTWHGTPVQREKARRQFPFLVALARRAGLTQPMTTAPFSVLHQQNVSVEHFNSASFDWIAWVEQEKRSRLIYAIFLTDASLVLYFNSPPLLDTLEIRLPLPADDCAWEARTSTQCAEALGLHGPVAARDRNPEGSRRAKQPEMHSALKALMHSVYELQPGTTNLYSKFILIHALHIQLWQALKQFSQESGQPSQAFAFPSSGTSTPISQNDWVTRGIDHAGSGPGSNNTSGRATPVEAGAQSPMAHQLLKATSNAFEKWKKAWDEDMAVQYPPSSSNYHRYGFCRDGVYFYWLAKYFMKNNRGLDWQMAPDKRFSHVMSVFQTIKSWVISDSAKRGEELGSVNDIDKDYGVTDLTLDMAQLFKPINKPMESPVAGVQTNLQGGNMI
ncbi:hypothetical protein B7494_g416 [Chlorociboria aeruginascens]|nr:hypothetical protein B7494_g416 [Chlorociboria aeruginascens]